MFVYILAVCLVGFYSSSGAPAPYSNATISATLTALAKTCENPILSSQILNKAKDCIPTVPPNAEKQFQCMLFLDINRQLCSAVAASTLAISEDYTTKIDEIQNIAELCNAAKDWEFSDLGEVYKKYVKLVFTDEAKCIKVCSGDPTDFLNVDSNFYCKYFKWGSEMLKKQITNPVHISESAIINPGVAAVNGDVHVPVNPASSKSTEVKPMVPAPISPGSVNDVQTKKESSSKDPMPPGNNIPKVPQTGGGEVSASDKVSSTNKATADSNVKPSPEHVDAKTNHVGDNEKVDNEPIKENSQPSAEQQPEVNPVGDTPDLAETVEKKPDSDVVDNKQEKIPDSAKNDIPPIDLKNNQNDIDPDYPSDIDPEDSRGSDTQQNDDDADPGLPEAELKPELDIINNNKRGEMQAEKNENSQKDYYRGDEFPEEEDHFFPFFLTAIIMIVLIYVLYHNKSKVSKVIMGLIVEGRQPGRRRNSRGHAYKRLDTLEQAMSTNSAAPPSKIIY